MLICNTTDRLDLFHRGFGKVYLRNKVFLFCLDRLRRRLRECLQTRPVLSLQLNQVLCSVVFLLDRFDFGPCGLNSLFCQLYCLRSVCSSLGTRNVLLIGCLPSLFCSLLFRFG